MPDGVTVVVEGKEPIISDVVFVHGLGGDSTRTWTTSQTPKSEGPSPKKSIFSSRKARSGSPGPSAQRNEVFWPRDLLAEDVPNIRVLTYGYPSEAMHFAGPANRNGILQHADNLLNELEDFRADTTRPVVFVCHSLGGIIVKKALLLSKEYEYQPHLQKLLPATYGVIFLGTPHRGAGLASWAALIGNLSHVAFQGRAQKLQQELQVDSGVLEMIAKGFSNLFKEDGIRIHSFHEERPMTGVALFDGLVVPRISSVIGDAAEGSTGIDANHVNMCKFGSKGEVGYVRVKGVIGRYTKEADERARKRAEEEEKEKKRAAQLTEGELLLLNRLNPANGAEYQADHVCMEKTRTTIVNDIISWGGKPFDQDTPRNNSNRDSILWLHGMPGIGKTYVANTLCRELHYNQELGGSFFCRRDDPVLREQKRVLPHLIYKLAQMWVPYGKLVAHALREDPHLPADPRQVNLKLLSEPLASLQEHPSRPLVLVIDALDECGDPQSRKRLLEFLLKACSHAHWLKIIITSRPEHEIVSFFGGINVARVDLAEDDQANEDIRFFARERFASIAETHHRSDGWPRQDQLNQIVERAGGLFIFVDTVCRFVDDPNPEPLLAQVLSGMLEGTDFKLYKLYSAVISSRIGRDTKAFHSFISALVIVSAHRPLSAETLASLIGLDSSTVNSWVDRLSSLLYRAPSDKKEIRARHLSVIEFLTGTTCPPEFRVDLEQANEELGIRCLTTMTKELKFNICGLETSHLLNSQIPNLEARVQQSIPDALQYSCMHWSSHLCFHQSPASPKISELLDELFTGARPLHWIEVLSLMGKVLAAESALRQMKRFIKKFEYRHQNVFDDTLRFVLAFRTPISASTPHIYVSSLPFTPTESILWRQVGNLSLSLIDVCEGRMQSWPARPGVWQGHTYLVSSVAFSPDGRHVASGSYDNTVRIWDTETGGPVGEPLKGHTRAVSSVAYSPDGRHVVSGSWDDTIRIWDTERGGPVGDPLKGHTRAVSSVAYSPDGRHVVSGSWDDTIRIWDTETGGPVGEPLKGHAEEFTSVAYSPDGHHVVSGSHDNTVRVWDTETGEPVGDPLKGHTDTVTSVAYSPDGRLIVSGSVDTTVRIWDTERGEPVGEPLKGHTDMVSSVVYSSDGRHVVSGSRDKTIRIWDTETGGSAGDPLKGHKGVVNSVAYSPDGRHVVSGSHDHTVRIWDTESGGLVGEPLKGHTYLVSSVAYSPDGRYVVSGSWDHTIRIWDTERGGAVGEPLEGHTRAVSSVAYSPDGRHVVSGSYDHTVRIWDTESGGLMGESLKSHTDWVASVAYSPDGCHVVSGSRDKTIRIWDTETGGPMDEPLKGHTPAVTGVAYSPHGHHTVSGSFERTIRIWNWTKTVSLADSSLLGSENLPFTGSTGTGSFVNHDGWVTHAEGLLFWVPEDCRDGLTCPAIMTIPNTGRNRVVRLDITHFKHGALWTEIFGGP